MSNITLLSNGIIRLRCPEPEDITLLYQIENDVTLWSISNNMAPYSYYQLRKYVEESCHDVYQDKQIRFMIERIADGAVMGCIDLTNINFLNRRAEVGIMVLKEFRHQGIGSTALNILYQYARQMIELNQLYSLVVSTNLPAIKLFTSNGFSQSGSLKEWLRDKSSYHDVTLFQKKIEKKDG